jgi:hypothetical protein
MIGWFTKVAAFPSEYTIMPFKDFVGRIGVVLASG